MPPPPTVTLIFTGDTRLVTIPNVGSLSFSGGVAAGQVFQGTQDQTLESATPFNLLIQVDTRLTKGVDWAVAQISLGKISNAGPSENAAWRITSVALSSINIPTPGLVTFAVGIQVGDTDGYLEGFSVGVQALGQA